MDCLLLVVTGSYGLLLVVTGCYLLLPVVTGCYWLLQVVTGCYRCIIPSRCFPFVFTFRFLSELPKEIEYRNSISIFFSLFVNSSSSTFFLTCAFSAHFGFSLHKTPVVVRLAMI